MISHVSSAVMVGLQPVRIEVEVISRLGIPKLIIIGLPGKAVSESKERLNSALLSVGIKPKAKRVIINLAPADLPKSHSSLELAMFLGLAHQWGFSLADFSKTLILGELSLDGSIKAIKGALPLILHAQNLGFTQVILPAQNANEVAGLSTIPIFQVKHVREILSSAQKYCFQPIIHTQRALNRPHHSFGIVGQQLAKQALLVAAAGGHHLLLIGPPGVGKSVLAQFLPELLPSLTQTEILEVNTIHSAAGLIRNSADVSRPFRAPSQSISSAALLGGGAQLTPGEVSLAHRGVLFLDELSEFPRATVDALRLCLEEKQIVLTSTSGTYEFPAQFSLIAATNPCLCGWFGSQDKNCTCSPAQLERFRSRLSSPLLDRIDLQIRVYSEPLDSIANGSPSLTNLEISLDQMRERVAIARNTQKLRYAALGKLLVSELTSDELLQTAKILPLAKKTLVTWAKENHYSPRSFFKVLRVAQTLADLEQVEEISETQVWQACCLRATTENTPVPQFPRWRSTSQKSRIWPA